MSDNRFPVQLSALAGALHDAAKRLESIAQAGMSRAPADIDLVEVLTAIRANVEVGRLALVLEWSDQESDIVPKWELTTSTTSHAAPALSGLLRAYSATALPPDRLDQVGKLLTSRPKD